jgi:hypothetical protein
MQESQITKYLKINFSGKRPFKVYVGIKFSLGKLKVE